MAAIYQVFLSGSVSDVPLTSGAVAFNSVQLASMPPVVAPDYMWVILDPLATAGTPEIVKVTAHTVAATSATITRGQQTSRGGGVARQHAAGTPWLTGATPEDLDQPSVYSQPTSTVLTTAGTVVSTVVSLAIPAQPRAGNLLLSGLLYRNQTVAADTFDVSIFNPGGAAVATVRNSGLDISTPIVALPQPLAANTAATYTLRIARANGTGTASTLVSNSVLNQLTALFIPA